MSTEDFPTTAEIKGTTGLPGGVVETNSTKKKPFEPTIPETNVNVTQRKALWSKFIGYNPEAHAVQLSTFALDNQLLIAQQSRRILALDTKKGHTHWKASTHYALTNPSASDKQHVFIATAEPRLLALKVHTGQIAWSVPLPNMTLAKVCTDNTRVIVKTIAGDVLAFNTKNGKILWRYQHKGTSLMLQTSSAPQLYENLVITGFPDGKLIALNRETGEKEWEHTIAQPKGGTEYDELTDIATDPVIEGDTIYVNAYQGKLKALVAQTGEVQWERTVSSYATLAIGRYIYTINDQNIIIAFDKKDGAIVWEQKAMNDRQLTGVALTPNRKYLIIGDHRGSLYWLSQETGNFLGKAAFTIASPILSLPLIHENSVYAITRRGQIAAWEYPATMVEPLTENNDQPAEEAEETTEPESVVLQADSTIS